MKTIFRLASGQFAKQNKEIDLRKIKHIEQYNKNGKKIERSKKIWKQIRDDIVSAKETQRVSKKIKHKKKKILEGIEKMDGLTKFTLNPNIMLIHQFNVKKIELGFWEVKYFSNSKVLGRIIAVADCFNTFIVLILRGTNAFAYNTRGKKKLKFDQWPEHTYNKESKEAKLFYNHRSIPITKIKCNFICGLHDSLKDNFPDYESSEINRARPNSKFDKLRWNYKLAKDQMELD